MSTLHDELVGLTAGQPAQPGDRLGAVTGRARSIRRRRAAASTLAVVALGLVGAGVVQSARPTPVRYTATPVTQWPDRSEADAKDLGFSAFSSWYGDSTDDAHLRWLYRGIVTPTGGDPTVVADFIATKDYVTWLVQAHIDRTQLDDHGNVLDPETSWVFDDQLDLATVKTPPSSLQHLVDTQDGTTVVRIEAPSARRITWRYSPLPFAPPVGTPTPQLVASADGVFRISPFPVTGPVTITDPAGHDQVVKDVSLLAPEAFPTTDPVFASGGTGTTSGGEHGVWGGSGYQDLDRVTGTRSVDIRCYGGGTMTATIQALRPDQTAGPLLATGHAPCDGQAHRAISSAVLRDTAFEVDVNGDRLQAFAYQLTKG